MIPLEIAILCLLTLWPLNSPENTEITMVDVIDTIGAIVLTKYGAKLKSV